MNIDEICNEYGITNYTINPDGSIDVNGNVTLRSNSLEKITYNSIVILIGENDDGLSIDLNEISKIDTIYKENLNVVDSTLYHSGYKNGQIDADNKKYLWKKVTQENGEIIYLNKFKTLYE